MTKTCANGCGTAVHAEPINVMGRTFDPPTWCATCAMIGVEAAPGANPEDTIREALERLGVNVPAHGRWPLDAIMRGAPEPLTTAVADFVRAVSKAHRWDPVRGLIIQGPTGVGKSRLAVAIMRELITTGVVPPHRIQYDRSRFVFGAIKSGYGDGTAHAELSARVHARLWVLDDFGTEHGSDDTGANLTDILSARELHPTIVTANLPRDAHGQRYAGEAWSRIRSRLGDRNFNVITMTGPDWRAKANP